jgi:hypothetical protein
MKTLRGLGFFLIFMVVALNIVYLVLALSEDDYLEDFGIVLRTTLGTVAVWFSVSIFVVYIKQSGLPFKTEQMMKNTRYISIIFILWTVSFVVKLIIYSVATGAMSNPTDNINEMLSALYVILINIVTDMIPYFSVLELKFIELFKVASSIRRRKNGERNISGEETPPSQRSINYLQSTPNLTLGAQSPRSVIGGGTGRAVTPFDDLHQQLLIQNDSSGDQSNLL